MQSTIQTAQLVNAATTEADVLAFFSIESLKIKALFPSANLSFYGGSHYFGVYSHDKYHISGSGRTLADAIEDYRRSAVLLMPNPKKLRADAIEMLAQAEELEKLQGGAKWIPAI